MRCADYLPRLLGAFAGAAVGTSWTRPRPERTPLMNIVVLIVLILAALLLLPVLLRL